MNLDNYLIKDREATFMFLVKSNSMREEGILKGDMVLARRTSSASPGQIIIAKVDGVWNIRYLRLGAMGLYLEAANAKYKPIVKGIHISAVVTAIIRKYE